MQRAIASAKTEVIARDGWTSARLLIVTRFREDWEVTLTPDANTMRHATVVVNWDGKVIRTIGGL
jgi:hypothetical protein